MNKIIDLTNRVRLNLSTALLGLHYSVGALHNVILLHIPTLPWYNRHCWPHGPGQASERESSVARSTGHCQLFVFGTPFFSCRGRAWKLEWPNERSSCACYCDFVVYMKMAGYLTFHRYERERNWTRWCRLIRKKGIGQVWLV